MSSETTNIVREDLRPDEPGITRPILPVDHGRESNAITRFLAKVQSKRSVAEFVLTYGEVFRSPAWDPGVARGQPKECFKNATDNSTALYRGPYGYAEGYVLTPDLPIPVLHAWNYDLVNCEVIDPTLGWSPDAEYFGVKIPARKLRRQLIAAKVYGALESGFGPTELVRTWLDCATR